MPVGLPQVSYAPQQCRVFAIQITNAWRDFLQYLDLPSSTVYWETCRTAYKDVVLASSSVGTLGYLTLKPFVLIALGLLQYFCILLQFLSRHLFHHAYESAKKGLTQAKFATREFYKWQKTLSNTEIGIELLLIAALIGAYLLRRHIQKRKYVQRATSWYRRKKRTIKQSYRRGVRRIADTSLFLAMLMPHVVFLASVASLKLLMPRVLTYLAADTYLLSIMSFWYPMMWTIGLLQYYRNGVSAVEEQDVSKNKDDNTGNYKTPARPKRRLSSSFFPRTTPSSRSSVQKWLRAATTPVRRAVKKSDDEEEYDVHDNATYWLQYWVVFSSLLAVCRLTFLLPIVGRIFGKYAMLSSVVREVQLVFFLWLFGVPLVTPELTRNTLPLSLLYQRVVPMVTAIYNVVSHAIPEQAWQTLVEKASSILDLAVMIKVLSTESKDWLVHVLEEARPVLPPAITLFMPGFLTEYGVLYVKTLVPCAKSSSQTKSLGEEMQWLEYWVLHGLLSSLLNWWAPILWWIPFSAHGVFLLWCHLQIPKTTEKWYNVFEEELQAFGLLEKGDKELQVEQTVTATMFRKLTSSLPSATDVDGVGEALQGEQQQQQDEKQAVDANEKHQQDADDDVVMDESETAATDDAQEMDASESWSSTDENRGSNVTTRRRSTRQRKKQAVN